MSSGSLQKTVSRVIFSFFDIANHDGGRGLWSLISCDDVITGSGPNQKNFGRFWVLGPTEFSSEVCFPLVSRASLRSATIRPLPPPTICYLLRYSTKYAETNNSTFFRIQGIVHNVPYWDSQFQNWLDCLFSIFNSWLTRKKSTHALNYW